MSSKIARLLAGPHSAYDEYGRRIMAPDMGKQEANALTLANRQADPNKFRGAVFDAMMGMGADPGQASLFSAPTSFVPGLGDMQDFEDAGIAASEGNWLGAGLAGVMAAVPFVPGPGRALKKLAKADDVVDAKKGIRAYHNSKDNIDKFDLEGSGKKWTWFSPEKDKNYAKSLHNDGTLYEVDLGLTPGNTIEVDMHDEVRRVLEEAGIDIPANPADAEFAYFGGDTRDWYEGMADELAWQAKNEGKAGAIIKNTYDGRNTPSDQILVFDDKMVNIVKKYGIAGALSMGLITSEQGEAMANELSSAFAGMEQ